MNMRSRKVLLALVAALATVMLLAGCGSHRVAPSIQTASDVSLDDALAELDALETPDGMDEALWVALKDALGEALHEQWGASTSRSGVSCEFVGSPGLETDSPRGMGKLISTPPTGEANRVNDLAIRDNGDGTFTLSWHYRNLGDYDQNGTVGISDITPLAMHYGESYEPTDVNCLLAVIDGSGNGRIGIEDITPIAMNFAVEVHHYAIEGAAEEAGAYELVSEIAQDAGTGEGRLEYSAIIESPAALWHRVVPIDSEGAPGEPSNAVLRPSNEPIIYEVSPTEGYQHEEYTFSATVTGAETLEYAWDFGGGAEPDTSSDSSPTVTLTDAGEYAATLTVTNAYGDASFPFTLTVSERDMWAHTWGGGSSEEAEGVAVDEEGNIYVLGYTESFGAGTQDSLVLKYSPEGQLLWARTWGGQYFEYPCGIAVLNGGNIIVGGHTTSFGAGADDIFILKYDPEGNLLMQKTWGTADYERVADMAVDEEDNIYFAGYWTTFGGSNRDGIVVKFTCDVDALWAIKWDVTDEDRGGSVAVNIAGDVYSGGRTGNDTALQVDCVLLEFSQDGALISALQGDSGLNESIGKIVLSQGEVVFCSGTVWDPHSMTADSYIVKRPVVGSPDLAFSAPVSSSLVIDESEALWAAGSEIVDDSKLAAVAKYDAAGSVIYAYGWGGESLSAATYELALDYDGNVVLAGHCRSVTGVWGSIGAVTEPIEFEFTAISPSSVELIGSVNVASGTECQPDGTEDIGGGGGDVLVLKNFPR